MQVRNFLFILSFVNSYHYHFREGILQLQVVPGNLIFTASSAGVIRVYNMRQELVKILRTSSLEGVPIRSMQILTSNTKISVFIGNNSRLTTWFVFFTPFAKKKQFFLNIYLWFFVFLQLKVSYTNWRRIWWYFSSSWCS